MKWQCGYNTVAEHSRCAAIVVRPKQGFWTGFMGADPPSVTLTPADLGREPTIYLVPECGNAAEEPAPLQTVFPTIFEVQLARWLARSDDLADALVLWDVHAVFDCQFHSTLLDLTHGRLIEEHV